MSRSARSLLLAIALATSAIAQIDPADSTPLTSKQYPYHAIPYQVDNVPGTIRGAQSGINLCNSSTQNQQSECQTLIVNNIGDMCLFAPPKPNSTIGDTEAIEVAWCTEKHGARLMPSGTLQGVQVLVTSKYIQYVGFVNQVFLDMTADDSGGELDPHGADLRGNPIGGLVYSNSFSGDNSTMQQIIDWNEFIGGGQFCFTMCNPSSTESDQARYCLNTYDRLGCAYNMPNNAKNGTFEVCDSDLKTPVGVYTSAGATLTYSQPFTGVLPPVPYTPTPPKSSNCVTYQSSALYSGLPTPNNTAAASTTPAPATTTGSSSTPPARSSASALGISSVAGILGTLFAVALLS